MKQLHEKSGRTEFDIGIWIWTRNLTSASITTPDFSNSNIFCTTLSIKFFSSSIPVAIKLFAVLILVKKKPVWITVTVHHFKKFQVKVWKFTTKPTKWISGFSEVVYKFAKRSARTHSTNVFILSDSVRLPPTTSWTSLWTRNKLGTVYVDGLQWKESSLIVFSGCQQYLNKKTKLSLSSSWLNSGDPGLMTLKGIHSDSKKAEMRIIFAAAGDLSLTYSKFISQVVWTYVARPDLELWHVAVLKVRRSLTA